MKTTISTALSRSWRDLTRADCIGLAAFALAAIVWALLPVIAQSQRYHGFADQREWLGVPRAADVLSNIAFVLVGGFGVIRLALHRGTRFSRATEAGMWCIAVGLACTGVGSAWYHLDPSDATLFWDRLPMSIVFAGVLGAAIAQRIGGIAGRMGLALLVPLGIASVVYWRTTGDLSLYVTLQLGGILMLLLLLLVTRKDEDPVPWAWVVAWYALAKATETADWEIWDATGGWVAGHTLKHLLAAAAGAAALWPLFARR